MCQHTSGERYRCISPLANVDRFNFGAVKVIDLQVPVWPPRIRTGEATKKGIQRPSRQRSSGIYTKGAVICLQDYLYYCINFCIDGTLVQKTRLL